MKRVVVISTSLRRGSNSDMLADKFAEGAKAAGNDVEKISLVGKNIQFCKGCLGCQKLGHASSATMPTTSWQRCCRPMWWLGQHLSIIMR